MTGTEGRRTTSVATAPEASRPVAILPSATDFLAGFDSGRAVGRLEAFSEAHRAGFDIGYRAGRADALGEVEAAEHAWRDQLVRDAANFAAKAVPWDELAERRGQHNLAEAQRQLLRAHGVTA